MAGIGTTGATMVRSVCFREISSGVRLYASLAGASLAVALLWQSFTVQAVTPQGIAMHFYQHVLRQLDGRSCPSYPVCSVYARQAIDQYGLLFGSWLALDRLIHENDDLQHGLWHEFEGGKRLNDPLSRNSNWIRREQ